MKLLCLQVANRNVGGGAVGTAGVGGSDGGRIGAGQARSLLPTWSAHVSGGTSKHFYTHMGRPPLERVPFVSSSESNPTNASIEHE